MAGTIAISGWILTPDFDTMVDGSDIQVPIGMTVTLFVDGQVAGLAEYGLCRGTVGPTIAPDVFCDDDVASVFGQAAPMPSYTVRTSNPTRYRDLDAGRGAIASNGA